MIMHVACMCPEKLVDLGGNSRLRKIEEWEDVRPYRGLQGPTSWISGAP